MRVPCQSPGLPGASWAKNIRGSSYHHPAALLSYWRLRRFARCRPLAPRPPQHRPQCPQAGSLIGLVNRDDLQGRRLALGAFGRHLGYPLFLSLLEFEEVTQLLAGECSQRRCHEAGRNSPDALSHPCKLRVGYSHCPCEVALMLVAVLGSQLENPCSDHQSSLVGHCPSGNSFTAHIIADSFQAVNTIVVYCHGDIPIYLSRDLHAHPCGVQPRCRQRQ